MIKEIIKLANDLDKNGFYKEADLVDGLIFKMSSLDEEEKELLNDLEKMLRNRNPEDKDSISDDVPYHIKEKIFNYWKEIDKEKKFIPEKYKNKSIKELEKESEEPLFWQVKEGDRGYEDSKDKGFVDEDGNVYYGEI